MKRSLSGLMAGALFGAGLLISQMTNPTKVLAFLDVTSDWDPSLAFVMGGAVLITFIGYRLVLRRSVPFFEDNFRLPTRQDIDSRLLVGAALFGIGWGLAGLCPGPALASASFGGTAVAIFTISMLVPMVILKRTLSF